MTKLKRTVGGNVFDCTIYEGRLFPNKWDDRRVGLLVVYWDGCEWTTEPLSNFVPAVQGIDY